ncbi:MAG TPA: hypothetical protein VKU00_30280, partial [Chthonomonadaceae bacterium]|nr:hypothetical protein [Chthonomonadaceae bacterium]
RSLNRSCVGCHRTGEIGPFALETYREAKVWAGPIKDYTARKLMPPWKPVPGHGDFYDANVLTDTERSALAAWAEAGAPEGDPKDLPPPPKFPSTDAWTLGTPDMIVQPVRDYHLEAEGRDVYRNFVLPVDFKEDRYLSGMEFKPGNRAIVHHIVVFFDTSGKSAEMDGKDKEPGYTVPGTGIGVGALWGDVWVPGSMPRRLPPGVGIKIPAGAKIVMQVHYHKTGKPETDRSRMALYFAPQKPDEVIHVVSDGTFFFNLKPGDAHQTLHGVFPSGQSRLPVDVKLWSIFPHMHMLGKEMKVTATLPDGTVKPLIWINDWDFNWQATYFYKEPIFLPKGTLIEMTAVYDNSDTNPRQTSHPPKTVRFGEQTTDEMCFVFLGFTGDMRKIPDAGGGIDAP